MLTVEINVSSPWFNRRPTHERIYWFLNSHPVENPVPIANHYDIGVQEVRDAVRDLQMAGFVYENDDDYLVTLPLDTHTVKVVLRG